MHEVKRYLQKLDVDLESNASRKSEGETELSECLNIVSEQLENLEKVERLKKFETREQEDYCILGFDKLDKLERFKSRKPGESSIAKLEKLEEEIKQLEIRKWEKKDCILLFDDKVDKLKEIEEREPMGNIRKLEEVEKLGNRNQEKDYLTEEKNGSGKNPLNIEDVYYEFVKMTNEGKQKNDESLNKSEKHEKEIIEADREFAMNMTVMEDFTAINNGWNDTMEVQHTMSDYFWVKSERDKALEEVTILKTKNKKHLKIISEMESLLQESMDQQSSIRLEREKAVECVETLKKKMIESRASMKIVGMDVLKKLAASEKKVSIAEKQRKTALEKVILLEEERTHDIMEIKEITRKETEDAKEAAVEEVAAVRSKASKELKSMNARVQEQQNVIAKLHDRVKMVEVGKKLLEDRLEKSEKELEKQKIDAENERAMNLKVMKEFACMNDGLEAALIAGPTPSDSKLVESERHKATEQVQILKNDNREQMKKISEIESLLQEGRDKRVSMKLEYEKKIMMLESQNKKALEELNLLKELRSHGLSTNEKNEEEKELKWQLDFLRKKLEDERTKREKVEQELIHIKEMAEFEKIQLEKEKQEVHIAKEKLTYEKEKLNMKKEELDMRRIEREHGHEWSKLKNIYEVRFESLHQKAREETTSFKNKLENQVIAIKKKAKKEVEEAKEAAMKMIVKESNMEKKMNEVQKEITLVKAERDKAMQSEAAIKKDLIVMKEMLKKNWK